MACNAIDNSMDYIRFFGVENHEKDKNNPAKGFVIVYDTRTESGARFERAVHVPILLSKLFDECGFEKKHQELLVACIDVALAHEEGLDEVCGDCLERVGELEEVKKMIIERVDNLAFTEGLIDDVEYLVKTQLGIKKTNKEGRPRAKNF